jgi:hypothetical protein
LASSLPLNAGGCSGLGAARRRSFYDFGNVFGYGIFLATLKVGFLRRQIRFRWIPVVFWRRPVWLSGSRFASGHALVGAVPRKCGECKHLFEGGYTRAMDNKGMQ